MAAWIIQMTVVVLSVFINSSHGKRDKILYCSACRAIVEELNYSISKVDPKKTVNVGSFRLNPDGTMTDKKVPLAKSETHLSELLDDVCKRMSDYALHVDPETKEKRYKRFAPRGDDEKFFPDINAFQFAGPESDGGLKFACETVVEELEDDIIALLTQNSKGHDLVEQLCNGVADYCEDVNNGKEEL